MNITEILLNKDKSTLKRERRIKTLFSPSLSGMLGENVEITIQELENNIVFELNQRLNDEEDDYNYNDFSCDMCLGGILEPDFHNIEIYEKFEGSHTPEEAIKVAFSAIEQMNISNELATMSNISPKKEDVENVKN